jgi:hypothetical protein
MLFSCSIASALEPGESIVLDPATGNYKLTYSDEMDDGTKILSHATFVPATKIAPTISSKLRLENGGTVTYSYLVTSGAQSRQVIDTVRFTLAGKVAGSQVLPTDMQTSTPEQAFAVLDANSRTLSTPSGWRGSVSIDVESSTSFVSWEADNLSFGIQPNGRKNGFGFISQSLPDLGVAKFTGARKFANGYGGEGPAPDSDIAKQIQALDENDFVPRNVAVPTIAVPVPFDAAVLLDRIRTHVATWPSKQLLDPALATQLDRYLVSAADAYRRNQLKAGKEHIETLREMLKREHKDLDHDDDENENGKRAEKNDDHRAAAQRILIDRLAARILDFDLKYVLKRTEREDDEHKKH